MKQKNLMEKMTPTTGWQDLTSGAAVYGQGNSPYFNTGDWRSEAPVWHEDKCKQCLLCFPVCPDSSIPVRDGKRMDFDLSNCKGCGICAKVCPFGAISMSASDVQDDKEEKK